MHMSNDLMESNNDLKFKISSINEPENKNLK